MTRTARYLPFAIFLALAGLFAWRLMRPTDTAIRSALVGQPVPEFALAPAVDGVKGLASGDLRSGERRLINIFASWCVPCIAEAPLLNRLAAEQVTIDGIAVRDRPQDVAAFLKRTGVRFQRIGADPESRIQLALGSSGVPESFIVDGRGIIRYHHVGPIEDGDLPAIRRAWEEAK